MLTELFVFKFGAVKINRKSKTQFLTKHTRKMKNSLFLIILSLILTSIQAQDFLYIREGQTFYNAKGQAMVARRFINISNTPQTVPEGKMWMTVENRYIQVEFASDVSNPNTTCGKKLKQTPYVMFNIIQQRPYEENEKWGVIFSSYTKVNGSNSKFEFIPDAFVREDFDFGLLKIMVPRMVGNFDIKFFPGTKVSVSDCIKNFQVIEVDMENFEMQQYLANVEIRKQEYLKRRAVADNLQRQKAEQEFLNKIKSGHIFETNELDEKPWYQLNAVNLLELFKQVYPNKFFIEFIINEDGSIKLTDENKTKFDKKVLNNYLRFTPGKIIVQDKKQNVKTKVKIIFASDDFKEIKKSAADFQVKKRKKEPIIEIKEYPANYTDKQLKKIIAFKEILEKENPDTYFFNIEYHQGTIKIIMDGTPQDELIEQKLEKYRYKYKTKKSGWKF